MIKNGLTAMGAAARELLRNGSALALFNLLYAALLAALYLFVATKESSVPRLVLTAVLALAAPILFFMIQAAGVNYTLAERRAGPLLKSTLSDFWKLILISLPVIALAVLVIYLLNKLQAHFPVSEAARPALIPTRSPLAANAPAMPLRWSSVLLTSLRLLLLGIVLPLAAIQLWIAVARGGLWAAIKNSWRAIFRALAPQSVLIYTLGLLVFGLMPYFLIFTRTPLKNGWAELTIFGIRLALGFVLTLWGWVITLGALTKMAGATDTTIVTTAVTQGSAVEPAR